MDLPTPSFAITISQGVGRGVTFAPALTLVTAQSSFPFILRLENPILGRNADGKHPTGDVPKEDLPPRRHLRVLG